jgi:hypothetical protein
MMVLKKEGMREREREKGGKERAWYNEGELREWNNKKEWERGVMREREREMGGEGESITPCKATVIYYDNVISIYVCMYECIFIKSNPRIILPQVVY